MCGKESSVDERSEKMYHLKKRLEYFTVYRCLLLLDIIMTSTIFRRILALSVNCIKNPLHCNNQFRKLTSACVIGQPKTIRLVFSLCVKVFIDYVVVEKDAIILMVVAVEGE